MKSKIRSIISKYRAQGLKTGDTVVIAKGTKYETKVTLVDEPKDKIKGRPLRGGPSRRT